MKEKSDTGAGPGRNKENPMSDMAQQAMKDWEQVLHNGLKFQQETGKWWTGLLNQTPSTQDWQKRVNNLTALGTGLTPAAQKRAEEVLELMQKNTRASADLVKKSLDAAQTPVIVDSQAKWMEVWTDMAEVMRSNAEAAVQIGGRALDSWIEFVQKNSEVTQIRVPKAA
jgi:hypothetical protein